MVSLNNITHVKTLIKMQLSQILCQCNHGAIEICSDWLADSSANDQKMKRPYCAL